MSSQTQPARGIPSRVRTRNRRSRFERIHKFAVAGLRVCALIVVAGFTVVCSRCRIPSCALHQDAREWTVIEDGQASASSREGRASPRALRALSLAAPSVGGPLSSVLHFALHFPSRWQTVVPSFYRGAAGKPQPLREASEWIPTRATRTAPTRHAPPGPCNSILDEENSR